jgi:hypothetical protein
MDSSTPSSGTPNIPTTALEFTEAELAIAKKWVALYDKADTHERYQMLIGKILPQLYLLNKQLTHNAWKDRKSVSICSILIFRLTDTIS